MPVYEEELQFLYNENLGNCSIDQELKHIIPYGHATNLC